MFRELKRCLLITNFLLVTIKCEQNSFFGSKPTPQEAVESPSSLETDLAESDRFLASLYGWYPAYSNPIYVYPYGLAESEELPTDVPLLASYYDHQKQIQNDGTPVYPKTIPDQDFFGLTQQPKRTEMSYPESTSTSSKPDVKNDPLEHSTESTHVAGSKPPLKTSPRPEVVATTTQSPAKPSTSLKGNHYDLIHGGHRNYFIFDVKINFGSFPSKTYTSSKLEGVKHSGDAHKVIPNQPILMYRFNLDESASVTTDEPSLHTLSSSESSDEMQLPETTMRTEDAIIEQPSIASSTTEDVSGESEAAATSGVTEKILDLTSLTSSEADELQTTTKSTTNSPAVDLSQEEIFMETEAITMRTEGTTTNFPLIEPNQSQYDLKATKEVEAKFPTVTQNSKKNPSPPRKIGTKKVITTITTAKIEKTGNKNNNPSISDSGELDSNLTSKSGNNHPKRESNEEIDHNTTRSRLHL